MQYQDHTTSVLVNHFYHTNFHDSNESDTIPKQASLYKEMKESANDNSKEDAFYLDMLSGDIYSLVDLNSLTQSTYEMKVIDMILIFP